MNLVFWSKEHQSGTNAHMMAVIAMLRLLGEPLELRIGRFVQKGSKALGICNCKTGLSGRKRHYLWQSDLTIVCLKQKKECIDAFFQKDLHLAKNMMYMLSGYECEEGADARYLERMYRVAPEQVIIIPYNSRFYQAFAKGRSEAFIKKEYEMPTSGENEQFVRNLACAVTRMMHQLGVK